MADAVARAWLTGTPEEPIINLDLPAGPKGEPGGWNVGTNLSTRNLNDITTPGLYYQGSTANAMNTALNYPPMADFAGSARGVLEVLSWSGGLAVVQRYTRIGRGASSADQPRVTYTRYRETEWSPWTIVAPTQVVLDDQGFKTYQTWDEGKNIWETTSGPGGGVTGAHLNKLHLDTITTAGNYRQTQGPDATLAQGYPVPSVGILNVRTRIPSSETYGPSVVQEYSPIFGVPTSESRVLYRRTQTGKVWQPWRAFSSQRVDNTAGRAIYTWDDTANREQLIYGDTGKRIINNLINPELGAAPVAKMRRTMYDVELHIQLNKPSGLQGKVPILSEGLPVGFRNQHTIVGYAGGASGKQYTLDYLGAGMSLGDMPTTATALFIMLKFSTTDPWPTTLPGTADGSIPNL